MEVLELILSLITAICGILPMIITTVCLIRNIIKTKNWKLIEKMALDAMSSVEAYAAAHPCMTSEEKLAMALDAVKAGLAAAGIAFDDELIKQIIAYIEELCKWSKTVNA